MNKLFSGTSASLASVASRRSLTTCLLAFSGFAFLSGCGPIDGSAGDDPTDSSDPKEQALSSTTERGPWGGNGGSPFDDSAAVETRGRMTRLRVWGGGTAINGLTAFYANGTTIRHGGEGGGSGDINLAADTHITSVSGTLDRPFGDSGAHVKRLVFASNKGQSWGFGDPNSPGGAFGASWADPLTLHSFFGRSGAAIDQIGFGYGAPPPGLLNEVLPSTQYGGSGGNWFDDLNPNDRPRADQLTQMDWIDIRCGAAIDYISVGYKNVAPLPGHGGGGGNAQPRWFLSAGEYITDIDVGPDPDGTHGNGINYLKFHTSQNRYSPPYGTIVGPIYNVKMDHKLLKGIYGRSGAKLDSLGFYFANRPATKMVVKSLTYQKTLEQALNAPPVVQSHTYTNNSYTATETPSMSYAATWTESNTTSVSETNGVHVELSFEAKYQVATAGLTVGYDQQRTVETSSQTSESKTRTFDCPYTVPPRTSRTMNLTYRAGTYNVPWVAQVVVTYDGSTQTEEHTVTGMLSGSTAWVQCLPDDPTPL